LTALAAIATTALVFHVVLAPLIPALTGAPALANLLLHTIVPVLCFAGWLLFGPRGVVRARSVRWSLVFPLGWSAHLALVASFYAALTLGLAGVDRAVARRSR
jgi:hypothetical protein